MFEQRWYLRSGLRFVVVHATKAIVFVQWQELEQKAEEGKRRPTH